MMPRILEKEVMDDSAHVETYAGADFSNVDELFFKQCRAVDFEKWKRVLDIGCGFGRIPIEIARRISTAHITAVDASLPMLDTARKMIAASPCESQIKLVHARIPDLPFNPQSFDAIISVYTLHHIPDPIIFWKEIKRLGASGATVMVMDFFRPESQAVAEMLVEKFAGNGHPLLKEDFYNSLRAAFTASEVRAQLVEAGLSHLVVEMISERHILISGTLS